MKSPAFRVTSALVSILLLVLLGVVVLQALRNNPMTALPPANLETIRTSAGAATPGATEFHTSTIVLGNEQRVIEGGFTFRPVADYALEVAGGSVNMSAAEDAPMAGALFLLSGGEPSQFGVDSEEEFEDLFEQYATFFAEEDGFRIGAQEEVVIDGIDGLAADLIGANPDDLFTGRMAMVQADDGRLFVLVGAAPVDMWQAMSADQFEAVLSSVRLIDESAVAQAAGTRPFGPNVATKAASAATPRSTPSPTSISLPSPTALSTPAPTATPTARPTRKAQWQVLSNANHVNAIDVLNNSVWAATDGGIVTWNVESNSSVKFATDDGLVTNEFQTVTACSIPGFGVVAGSDRGLQVFDTKTGNWRHIDSARGDLRQDDVVALHCNDDGYLAVAYGSGGVDIYDANADEWTYLDQADGLDYEQISHVVTVGDLDQIWLASELGLSVFSDGASQIFSAANSPLDTSEIRSLLIDEEGAAWVGAFQNVYKIVGDEFSVYSRGSVTGSDFPAGFIDGLALSGDGSIWIGSSNGEVCNFDPEEESCTDFYVDEDGMAPAPLTDLAVDGKGRVVYATERDGVSLLDEGEWRSYETADGYLASNRVQDLAQGSDGMIWVATDSGIQKVNETGEFVDAFFSPANSGLPSADVLSLHADNGGIWIGSEGVSYFDGEDWITYTTEDGLVADEVTAMTTDSQKRTWFGSDSGLSIWNGSVFFNLTAENGLPSAVVTDLAAQGDSVWIATQGGGLYRFESNQLQVFNADNIDLPSDNVSALATDGDGVLLIGGDRGLVRFAEGGVVPVPEMEGFSIVSLATEDSDEIWVVTEADGIWRFDGESWEQFDGEDALPRGVTHILVDDAGGVWFGGESGAARYTD